MKNTKVILCAAMLALVGCVPCYADAITGKTKVATQEWVRRALAANGIRVSSATVTTNITTEGGATVTNYVFTSPFHSEDATNIVAISLTFSAPSRGSATPTRGARLLRAGGGGAEPIRITLKRGELLDGSGGGFLFDDQWDMEWTDFPEAPPDSHVCELDGQCNCVEKDNTEESVRETMPEEYRTLTAREIVEKWPDPSVFYPNWGEEEWQVTRTLGGRDVYFVMARDLEGVREQPFRVSDIGYTDAWRDAMLTLGTEWNAQMQIWQSQYVNAHICPADNPQHNKVTKTCGQYSWTVCANGCGYRSGTERHQYPGASLNDTYHKCVCGRGDPEAHGTLVASGSKTPTYNGDGRETGWTQTFVCPSGCGYSKAITHVHHFTNCGTCDAGDGCSTVCTGCSGNHVFGEPTVTGIAANDLCAKCECTMCEGCNAHPPASDITKHAGWLPCSKDVEQDNDDGTANGGHCQCQCLVFGHDARTEHDYQFPDGMADREQITDHTAPTRAATYHYQIIGQCTRCKQYKKKLEAHDWPENPTEYRYVSDSVCAWLYECEKCQQKKRDETHGHELGGTIVYVNVSASICRQRKQCEHCKAYIDDDTHGHTRDNANGCKCANGCGYQFEHNYVADACGNNVCSYCGAYQYSQESHAGYKSGGTYSAAGHQCACGVKPDVPHVFGTPVEVARAGWIVTYRETCTACGYPHEWTVDANPCKNGHVGLPDACGCMCGYYSPTSHVATAKSLHHWTEGGTNNNPECICDCGNAHQFKEEGTYDRNRFPQYTNVVQCLGICWACKERDSNDRIVSAEDHQPIAAGDQAGAARCGCRCGKVKSTLYERFHYRNSGGVGGLPSCRCYGENARASGATAGSYHFRDPSACPNVCSVVVNGERHIAASHDKVYAPSFVKADVKAHEVKDWGTSCGCKCGLYDASNWTEWNGKMDFHRQAVSCCCGCPGKKHFPIARSNCTRLCGGNCTGLASDDVWGQHSGASYDPAYHDPSDVACKCQCGYFSGASAPDKFHSLTNSSKRCYCIGLHKHKFPHPRADCTGICSICGNGHQYAVAPSQPNEPGQHDWDGLNCKCNCPEAKLWPGGHRFADNACVCTCGEQTRGHVYQQHSKTQTGTHTCPSCGNTITEYHIIYKCKRCGNVWDGVDTEEGHASNCGEGDGGGGDSGTHENYCEKHNRYYDLECPDCKDEDEGGGGAGGGSGGSTGGGGGYRDI